METYSKVKTWGGWVHRCRHTAATLGGLKAQFSAFIPSSATALNKVPLLVFLPGLTCSDETPMIKLGAYKMAEALGLALVFTDTSPRGAGVAGEDDEWDVGTAAGFYINATEKPWDTHYRMFDYVVKDIPAVMGKNFPIDTTRMSITGHSMGGHGAMVIALNNPGMFKSVSAFAPCCNPCVVPWGQKAYAHYLGADKNSWKKYDTVELLAAYKGPPLNLFVDQGLDDGFLKGEVDQLHPHALVRAAKDANIPLIYRAQSGYDHSYYFLSTFIDDHLIHHASFLKQ